MAEKFPDICEEWDYERNEKGPEKYSPGSNQKVYWVCKKNPCGCHKWKTTIYQRTKRKIGCPYCSNRSLCGHNNFAAVHPRLAEEWDYERNEKGPENYPPSSGYKAYWVCKKNPCGCHKWKTSINHRTSSKTKCPYCCNQKPCKHNNLAVLNPKLLKEWDYEENRRSPEEFFPYSGSKVKWVCKKNPKEEHKWESSINNRTKGNGCPYCSKRRVSKYYNLALIHPQILDEWDYERNEKSPENYSPGSNKKVHWVCKKNPCGCHHWLASIKDRTGTKKSGCLYCSNRLLCEHNNFAAIYPEIAEEWDCERNKKKAEDYSPGSNKEVYWVCKKNPCGCHRWKSTIATRTGSRKIGCPYCANQKLCPHNNLAYVYPKLLEEWDYEKNEKGPENYFPGTSEKVHWVCKNGHRWKTSITKRTCKNRRGCPICNQSKGEKAIINFFKKHNIFCIREQKYSKCIHKSNLRYDFFLPDFNLLVEYDGRQHFSIIEHFGGKEEFRNRKKRDEIKTIFASIQKIQFLRISYLEFKHIDIILSKLLFEILSEIKLAQFHYNVTKLLTVDKSEKIDKVLNIYCSHEQLYNSNSKQID